MACSHCGYDPSQDQLLLLPILPENTSSESTEIRKYLSICRARVGVLDRRIERVERALDILCACREHAQALKGVNKDVEEAEGVSGIKVEFREFFPGSPKGTKSFCMDCCFSHPKWSISYAASSSGLLATISSPSSPSPLALVSISIVNDTVSPWPETSLLESLTKARAYTSIALREYSIQLSPIRFLPAELLMEIFNYLPKDGQMNARSTPLRLSHVSSYWRSFVQSMPLMWSTMRCSFRRGDVTAKVALESLWLEHSGQAPLTIMLRETDPWEYTSSNAATKHPLLNKLLQNAHRWQSLTMSVSYPVLLALSSARKHLHNLQKFTLVNTLSHRGEPFHLDHPGFTLRMFEDAPKLRDVSLGEHADVPMLGIPWGRLTRLDMKTTNLSLSDIVGIFREASKLEEVDCYCAHSIEPAHFGGQEPIPLESLTGLRIATEVDLAPFLDRLYIPSIRVLDIEHMGPRFTWTDNVLVSLLSRSNVHTLEKMVLTNLSMDDSELLECIRLAPSLMELKLFVWQNVNARYITDHLIRCLTIGSESHSADGILAPKLKALMLSGDLFPTVSITLYEEMIRSRWGAERIQSAAELEAVEWTCFVDAGALPTRDDLKPAANKGTKDSKKAYIQTLLPEDVRRTVDRLKECQNEGLHVTLRVAGPGSILII